MSLEEQEPEVGSLIESERGNERNSAGRWWHPWITKEDWGSFSTKTKRAIELISIIFIFLSIFVIYVDVKFILVQRSWNNYDTPGFPLDIRSASDLYGLFWVTENSVLHKVRNGDENFNSSALEKLPLEAFDPRKPTVIYIHGWEKGSIARRFMETTHYKNNDDVYGDDIHAVNEWKSKGWNFGIWYWGRFSDEDDVMLAESKIWSFDGPSKMRWRKNDLSFDEETYASVFQGHSIGDLLFDEISASMKNRWVNTSFRIIGHSLGAQLTLNLCDKILNMESESRSILPSRIDLADPFLTIYSKPYFPFQEKETVQDFSIKVLRRLRKLGIPVLIQQSSTIADFSTCTYSSELKDSVFFVRLFPNYISSWDLASRHVAGANLVMRQYPSSSSKDGFKLDSSFLSNEEVIRFGTIGLALEQTAGFETIDNKDDKFLKVENSRVPKGLTLPQVVFLAVFLQTFPLLTVFIICDFGCIYFGLCSRRKLRRSDISLG